MEKEVRALRPRDELEKQIAAQIALGTITSLEEAEKKGDVDVIEYNAQALSDAVRLRTARRPHLSLPVIRYLANDRNEEVRAKIVSKHYKVLTEQMKDTFLRDAVAATKALKGKPIWKRSVYSGNALDGSHLEDALATIMQRNYINADHDSFVVDVIKQIGYNPGEGVSWIDTDDPKLRNMPKTVEYIFNDPESNRLTMLSLMRADSCDRVGPVTRVLKMKVGDLRDHFRKFQRDAELNNTHIKTETYNFIGTDPDPHIRRMVVDSITHLPSLAFIAANDSESLIRRKANSKVLQLRRRAAYAKKYHGRKTGRYAPEEVTTS